MTEESVRNSSSWVEIALLVTVHEMGLKHAVAYCANCPEGAVGQGNMPFSGHFATSGSMLDAEVVGRNEGRLKRRGG
jgi:hypothetical protein